MVAVVIPAYRAAATLPTVVNDVLSLVDAVFVVDDCCPESCGEKVREIVTDSRLTVLFHAENRGVGGATKTGIAAARLAGAQIIIKVDADGQMDTRYIPQMIGLLNDRPDVVLVKGNRFAVASTLRTMPALRLFGNSGLTFLVKLSSGYWTLVDPTNGYFAVRSDVFEEIALEDLAERYFFEVDLLCQLGLRKKEIAEFQMPAIYRGEVSSLSITRALTTFPPLLAARFARRLLLNYLIIEINVGSLYGGIGIPLLLIGLIFGATEWHASIVSGVPRTTGTIILALMTFMIGFQLLLQALVFDVQVSPRTIKVRSQKTLDDNADRRVTVEIE